MLIYIHGYAVFESVFKERTLKEVISIYMFQPHCVTSRAIMPLHGLSKPFIIAFVRKGGVVPVSLLERDGIYLEP